MSRAIPLHIHGALEVLAAPLLIVAPFLFGFGELAGAVSIALGVVLLGLAISITETEGRGSIPLRSHAELDYTIAVVTIIAGVVLGIAADNAGITAFMAGFGALHMALTASTRFSRSLSA